MSTQPARLLVVDDNEMNRDMLSRRLERAGHQVVTADGGEAALERIAALPFDLVLLDVMMPGIDGFEVLRRIRAARSANELPVIMATAKDQREDVVEALKLGANDYVTKPLDFPVVLARVSTQLELKRGVDQIRALERDLQQRNEILDEANRRMKRELAAAAKVQHSLLPSAPPRCERAGFAWEYQPCDELAGDILNVFRLNDRCVGFYLLDVSGHGVAAALLSVAVSRVLSPLPDRSSVVRALEPNGAFAAALPSDVAGELNRQFPLDEETQQYFTLLYGVYDELHGELTYVNAGHPAPVHLPGGGAPIELGGGEFPVGWMPQARYSDRKLTLAPGDRLYLYSDGVSEARNAARELYGRKRVIATLEAARGAPLKESLAELVAAAAAWGGGPFEDDVSAIALEVRKG